MGNSDLQLYRDAGFVDDGFGGLYKPGPGASMYGRSIDAMAASLPVVDISTHDSEYDETPPKLQQGPYRYCSDNSNMRNMLLSRRQRLWLWLGTKPLWVCRFRHWVYRPPWEGHSPGSRCEALAGSEAAAVVLPQEVVALH